MKKVMIIVLLLALALGTTSLAFAVDTPSGIFGGNPPQLTITDEQKAQITSYFTQMLELRKQIFKQNVENGTITEEQSKFMEDRMNDRLKAMESGQWGPGMGRRMGGGHWAAQQPQAQ